MKTIKQLQTEYMLTLRPVLVRRGKQYGWGACE